MQKIVSLIIVFTLFLGVFPIAYAEDETTPADDPVISELIVTSSLSFNGTTAICSATVTEPNKYIHATMTLSNGSTVVGSWSAGGPSVVNLSGSCTVVKGQSYTLVISGTVGGQPFSTTPITKTC